MFLDRMNKFYISEPNRQMIDERKRLNRSESQTSGNESLFSSQNTDIMISPNSTLSNSQHDISLVEILPLNTRQIQNQNFLPFYSPKTLIYNVLLDHLFSLACMGYVQNQMTEDSKSLVRKCFIYAIEQIKSDPSNCNSYKPFLLLGPLLFLDSNKKNRTSLGSFVKRCETFLNDQWKFTVDISKYSGRFYIKKKQKGNVVIPVDMQQNESRVERNKSIVLKLLQNDLQGAVQLLMANQLPKPSYDQSSECLDVNIKPRIDRNHELFSLPSNNFLNYGGRIGNKRIAVSDVIKTLEKLNTHSHSGPDSVSSWIYKSLCGFNTENNDLNSVGLYVESLTYLINTVFVDPVCPLQITSIMASSEGVAIRQSATKTRGISMVNDIAESSNLSSEIQHIKQILDHVNFGVFQKSGVDIIVHVTRIYHEIHPDLNILITDYKDAFPNISRRLILQQLVAENLDSLLPMAKATLIPPTQLWFFDKDHPPTMKLMEEGTPMGATISSVYQCLATMPLNRQLREDVGPNGLVICYVDDTTLGGTTDGTLQAFCRQKCQQHDGIFIKSKGARVLLGLKPSTREAEIDCHKYLEELSDPSAVVCPHPFNVNPPFFKSSSRGPRTISQLRQEYDEDYGVTVMKIPIGSDRYTEIYLENKLERELRDFALEIPTINNSQISWHFLQESFSKKVVHLARMISHMIQFADQFEQLLRYTLCKIVQIDEISDMSFEIVLCLPGGSNLPKISDMIVPAYVASFAAAIPELTFQIPDFKRYFDHGLKLPSLPGYPPSLYTFHECIHQLANEKDSTPSELIEQILNHTGQESVQSMLMKHRNSLRLQRLQEMLKCDKVAERHFKKLSQMESLAWLRTRPNQENKVMSTKVFNYTFRRLLRMPQPIIPGRGTMKCTCSRKPAIDVYGDHLLCCTKNSYYTIQRHNLIAVIFNEMLRNTGQYLTSLHFPPPFKAQLNVNEIGDIMATCIRTHQKTMYDVTIVHNEITGDLQKHKKYGLLCKSVSPPIVFKPLSFNTMGGFHPDCLLEFDRLVQLIAIAKTWDLNSCREYYLSRISISIHTLIAEASLHRIGDLVQSRKKTSQHLTRQSFLNNCDNISESSSNSDDDDSDSDDDDSDHISEKFQSNKGKNFGRKFGPERDSDSSGDGPFFDHILVFFPY